MINFKKFLLAASLLACIPFVSCSDDDNNSEPYACETCVDAPEALAENDALGKGVYKGIVIGSSGTIKFSIANGTNDITASMVLDGETIILTSNISYNDGQPYVAPFTGIFNGETATINFSVDDDGENPTVTSADIPGHPNAVFTIIKETSNALVEGYEGTYSKSNNEHGTFNILLSKALGKWGGIARKNGETEPDDIHGVILPDGTLIEEHGYNVGKLVGETISGSFVENNGATVTINAHRTL